MRFSKSPPSGKTFAEGAHLWVALVIGLGTILYALWVTTWKVADWAHRLNEVEKSNSRLKEENEQVKEVISRLLEVDFAANRGASFNSPKGNLEKSDNQANHQIPLSVNELAGTWELRFRKGNRARVGLMAKSQWEGAFHGEIPQREGVSPLKLEGSVKLVAGVIKALFMTMSDDGKTWHGEGIFKIESRDSLHGWYVDQDGIFDIIDVRRIP